MRSDLKVSLKMDGMKKWLAKRHEKWHSRNSFNLSQLFFIGGRCFLWVDNLPLWTLLAVVPLPVGAHHVEGCGDGKSHDLSLLLDAETESRLITTHKVPARCSNGNALAVSKNSRIFSLFNFTYHFNLINLISQKLASESYNFSKDST